MILPRIHKSLSRRANDLRSRVKYLKFVPDVARYAGSTPSSGTTRRSAIQTIENSYSRMGMDWIFRMANSWARFGDVTINGCLMEPLVEHWRTCLYERQKVVSAEKFCSATAIDDPSESFVRMEMFRFDMCHSRGMFPLEK